MKNLMLNKIKEIVSQEEIKEIDRVIEEIYSIDDDSNTSVAFQWGFNTLANLNGKGYENLVLIADSLNGWGEDAAFARFILAKVLTESQIEELARELLTNETHYRSILWPA